MTLRSVPALSLMVGLQVGCGSASSVAPASPSHTPEAEHGGEHGAEHGAGHGGAHGHHGHHHGMPHRFENAAEWAKRFDALERNAWQKPEEVISALALPRRARVADVGAGTGYFAVRLARAVPEGQVLALDVEPDMVRYVNERARTEGLSNLTARQSSAERSLTDDPTDLVLVVNTYHHLEHRVSYFKDLHAHLAPNGRVAIVDFRKESDKGPPPEHKIAREVVVTELGEAGFALAQTFEFLPDQYFLVFQRRP